QKPFSLSELEVKAKRALEHHALVDEVNFFRAQEMRRYDYNNIVGVSAKMKVVLDLVKRVSRSDATIMVGGETGTGKELIAGAIHRLSPRRDRAFVKVNCAALPENLLESELFGHEKGAFTGADRQRIGRFEQAHQGTIFMDEVGDMSRSTQAKLLRVLQEEEFERLGGTKTIRVDVRVIAATNKDLVAAMDAGAFREDLFYRLNVVSVQLPPLRDRPEDIEPIANYYLDRFTADLKKKVGGFSPEAKEKLVRYSWPGNIRELGNAIERAVLLAEGKRIEADDISLSLRQPGAPARSESPASSPPAMERAGKSYREIERETLIHALEKCQWVQKDAAEMLSLSRRVMHYKIHKHGIRHKRWRRKSSSVP
ncbi:MAG: sigma-54 interaction domain-containing protein, partial [Vicinamibacteria bacterium]